jgi:hypothetical protein
MNNTKTKKRVGSIQKETKKKSKKIIKSFEDRNRFLENSKNPIYKKYLIEFQNFFKNKKKNDKAKRKEYKFEYLNDKLIKSKNTNKTVIELPKYIIPHIHISKIEEKMKEMNNEICYIKNVIDFCAEEDLPSEIISRYDTLNKEYRTLDNKKKLYEECINEINNRHENEELKTQKVMDLNIEIRKNRDLYFIIQEKIRVGEDVKNEFKDYFEQNNKIQKKKETLYNENNKDIYFLIDKLPSL